MTLLCMIIVVKLKLTTKVFSKPQILNYILEIKLILSSAIIDNFYFTAVIDLRITTPKYQETLISMFNLKCCEGSSLTKKIIN